MSDDKKGSVLKWFLGVLGAVALAVLTGQNAPQWLNKVLPSDTPPLPKKAEAGLVPQAPPSIVASQTPPPFRPATGHYASQGTMHRGSNRFIATVGGETCIALVDGIVGPDSGYRTTTVSRLMWRDENFYINATNKELIFPDRTSFVEGRVGWELLGEKISEPYKTLINNCLNSNDDKYKFIDVGEFQDSPSKNSTTNFSPSPSGALRVQNFPDGDYFFASNQPPNPFGDIFLFRKQGNSVIGYGGVDPGEGSCLKQEVLSDSQVRTEKATTYIENRKAQVFKEAPTDDDGSFWSSELSQVDVEKYTGFAEQIQACTDMFTN